MKRYIFYMIVVLLLVGPNKATCQRSHELRANFSLYRNYGVAYYDFFETSDIRHNFEWDQTYKAQLIELGYRYPISPYVFVGVFGAKSINARMLLQQAESATYYFNEATPQIASVYSGLTTFTSDYFEIGVDLKVNHILRAKKMRFSFIIGPSIQFINNESKNTVEFETEVTELQNDLVNTYTGKEHKLTVNYAVSFGYPLKKGFTLNLLEVMGKYTPESKNSKFFAAANSLSIKTGIIYQINNSR